MAVNVSGGWTVDPQMQACNLPQEVATAFSEAVEDLDGAVYTPVLYCGSQVVSGTNHMLICTQRLSVQNPITTLAKVAIHRPLQGKSIILSIVPLDPFAMR